jgi:hypothetical protein
MVVRRSEVLVPMDRNPLEVYLLGLCVLSGAVSMLSPQPSPIPAWANVAWYGLIAAGGLVGMVGTFCRDAITGTLIVRAAMIPVGAVAYLYAVMVGVAAGPVAGLVVAAFGVSAHLRAWQISRQLSVEWRRK